MRRFKAIALGVAALVALVGAYSIGRDSVQNANDLIRAGFTITDPEGFPVDRFDEGLHTAFPWYYW